MLGRTEEHLMATAGTDRISSLRMEGITKRFPGILACDNISLSVGEGEILALVGENGAGKTTLMNILMGLYHPDEGRILINGTEALFRSPSDAFSAGIGMVHQQYMLVANMTVLENIALGYRQAWSFLRVDLDMVRARIDAVAVRYGLAVDPDAYVWQLSIGEQQRVELVKTLCLGARFLILDEPTSALTPQETDELIVLLKRMSEELSIIFISHKLHEVKDLSDRVVILRHGAVVFEGSTADHSSGDIAALMTGREVTLPKNEAPCCEGCEALSISGLKVRSDRGFFAVDGLDLSVCSGEIVGLAGVSGNGQRELAEAINGLRRAEEGKILFFGQDITNRTPHDVIEAGMGYIPEERNTEGIVPPFSMKENFILKDSGDPHYSTGSFLQLRELDRNAERLRTEFDIRSPDTKVAAGSLSGGNIQKVILARELSREPRFLIAVYPTRGLDMGAAEFIHRRLLEKRAERVGILLISEELEEILDLSDRIAVIFKGRIIDTLDRGSADRGKLGILMAGVKERDDEVV